MRRLLLFFVVSLLVVPVQAGRMKRQAPPLTVSLPGGKSFDVHKQPGKVVVLEVMLTTCPHCKDCAKVMEKLYREMGPNSFQPIAIAINDNAEELVVDYVKELGLTFPVGFGDRDAVMGFLKLPPNQPAYTPVLVFVDKKSQIRAQYMGTDYFFRHEEKNMRELLAELMGE
jgi:thiol-disulfide isomerase/thioredoxin